MRCRELGEGRIAAGPQWYSMPRSDCMTQLSIQAEHRNKVICLLQLLRTAWRELQAVRNTLSS